MIRTPSISRPLVLILVISLFLRLFFILFGAHIYFDRENIFMYGDTYVWATNIMNLIDHGTYTIQADHEYGYFSRTPGYSFFIGIFYLLTGKDIFLSFKIIGWVQVFIDIFSVYLLFRIGMMTFKKTGPSLVLAALYGSYPFIIVWNPVVYAEAIGIFLMIVSIYFFLNEKYKYRFILTGIFLGIAILFRPQIALLVPVFGIVMVFRYYKSFKELIKYSAQLGIMVLLIYGAWPARNYINHGKLIFTRDLQCIPFWSSDVRAYWDYIFDLKAEWEPQFSQIVQNKEVEFPKHAYKVKGDSVKLAKVVDLCKDCGLGFSRWPGYWKTRVEEGSDCNEEIVKLFSELRANQRKHNTLNVFVWVPMQNLWKAVFKAKLYDQSTSVKKAASLLFYYRTFLILLGFIGLILMWKQLGGSYQLNWMILLYVASWYFYLAFIYRNMEIRYLLPADVLLLIPGSYVLYVLFSSISKKQETA